MSPVVFCREPAPRMMQHAGGPGPIIAAAVYAQAMPAAAYLLTRRKSLPTGYVAMGGLLSVLATAVGFEVARRFGNNRIVGYVTIPLVAGAYLLALAEWQISYVERLTLRIGIALFIAIYLMLVIFLEDFTHFGQFSHTLYSLVLLTAALWTLGRRALTEEEALAIDTDWFWTVGGLAMYGAATAAAAAIGNILLERDRVDLFARAWNVRGALVILAFLAISWGVFRGPASSSDVDLSS